MNIIISNVNSVDEYLALIDIIEPHEECDECALATSAFTDKSNLFIRIYCQIKSFEDPVFFPVRVSEPDILKFDDSLDIVFIENDLGLILID